MEGVMKYRAEWAGLFVLCVTLLAFCVVPGVSCAELYQWTDKDGVLHITDDLGKVPEDKRWKVKKFETTPAVKEAPESAVPAEVVVPEEHKGDLYGDETLEWWVNTFKKKNDEAQAVEGRLAARKQFIDVFEGGRRLGQVYAEEDVKKYQGFKEGLPKDEAELVGLKAELGELRRQATIHGVPKEIRGE